MTKMERLNSIVGDDLFDAFWDGVAHFNSTDLVIYFDEDEDPDKPVRIFDRKSMLEDKELPDDLRNKITDRPRVGTVISPSVSFWLVTPFEEGLIVVAVNAKRLSRGGSA